MGAIVIKKRFVVLGAFLLVVMCMLGMEQWRQREVEKTLDGAERYKIFKAIDLIYFVHLVLS